MSNIDIKISNSLNSVQNSSTHNFYNTDKFVYIILNKIPQFDLTAKIVNTSNNNFMDIPMNIYNLQSAVKNHNIPFCTIPVISLYTNKIINEWKLFIISNSKPNIIIKEFNITVKIIKNFTTNKPILLNELCCGIFFEQIV